MSYGGPKPWQPVVPVERPARPRISVVIPIHGHQPLVAEQITALAGQDYDGWWEVLICDNGCDEATRSLIDGHRPRPARLRVVDATARPGASYARNLGAVEAEGDLLAIADSDDEVGPGWLSALARAAADAEMVGGHVDYEQLNSRMAVAWRPALTVGALPVQLGFLPFAVGCNMAIWKDVWMAVGGCDEEMMGGRGGDDVDLSWRVQLAGGRLAFAPDAVAHYRLRADARSLARQMYGYGQSSALLYRNFRRYGAQRQRAVDAVHFWLHVLRRGPALLRDPERAGFKLSEAAYHLGEVRGALRYRVGFW